MLRTSFVMVLWLLASTVSAGQQNTPPPERDQNSGPSTLPGLGQVDFGLRGTIYGDDADRARYQRYRDLRNGPFGENVLWKKSDDHKYWDVRMTHAGYRDQQYAAHL